MILETINYTHYMRVYLNISLNDFDETEIF